MSEVKVITSCCIDVDPTPVKRQTAKRSATSSITKMGRWEELILETLEARAPNGGKINFAALKDSVIETGIATFQVKRRSTEKAFGQALKELQFKKLVTRNSGNMRLIPQDMGSEESSDA